MKHAQSILVAIDASKDSDRTVDFVGAIIGDRPGFELHLLHVLGALPPDMP